jgi:hypothetical protein
LLEIEANSGKVQGISGYFSLWAFAKKNPRPSAFIGGKKPDNIKITPVLNPCHSQIRGNPPASRTQLVAPKPRAQADRTLSCL